MNSLIVFSGLDGAGKSTQITLLANHLIHVGKKPVHIWSRAGYTNIFQKLKTLSRMFMGKKLSPSGNTPQRRLAFSKKWVRCLWLNLALLDLLWLYGMQIRWHRFRGRTVLCDRYLWDTFIDIRLNFSQETINNYWLWRFLVRISPKPDVSFLMLVSVKESIRRSEIKNEPFPDSPEILRQRLTHYLDLAERAPFYILDGAKPASETLAKILSAVNWAQAGWDKFYQGPTNLCA